jgi:hypothetical protein
MTKRHYKTNKNFKKFKKVKMNFKNSNVTIHKIEPNNASDFEEKVKGMNGTILFHHPGCIHCIALRPNWDKMVNQLKNKNIPCRVLEVNAESLSNIHHPLGNVDSFPRIINVDNGIEKDVFSDERNVENMLNFVLSNLKGNKNLNLPYNYNLNEKNNIKRINDINNISRVRRGIKVIKSKKNKTKTKTKTKKNKTKAKGKRAKGKK